MGAPDEKQRGIREASSKSQCHLTLVSSASLLAQQLDEAGWPVQKRLLGRRPTIPQILPRK